MCVVVRLFLVAACATCSACTSSQADLTRPFYDPATFSLPSVLTGASIAVPDLHRLRRHLDAVRGGREPAPQHPAGHRAHLPHHRHPRVAAGVRRAARLARRGRGFPDVDTAFVHVAGKAGGASLFVAHQRDAARGQHRLGHGRAARARRVCSTAWAAATPCRARFFGARRPQDAASRATTCCSSACSRSSAACSLELPARRRDAELRRVHRLHGREPRGVRRATGSAATRDARRTSCCRCSAS